MWSSWVVSHFGSTVSWNLFLSCASQTWLDSHGVSFSQWPFRGREFNICKALWGHWGKKSLCSSEEFPGELLGTWETRQRLLPGWERVCASKCAHTHTQCRVQSREGMGPTGKSIGDVGSQTGCSECWELVIRHKPSTYPRELRIPTTVEDSLWYGDFNCTL